LHGRNVGTARGVSFLQRCDGRGATAGGGRDSACQNQSSRFAVRVRNRQPSVGADSQPVRSNQNSGWEQRRRGGPDRGLGSDAAGSVRLPAAFCGITAIKPTSGLLPRTGHFPPAGGWIEMLWQIGPMARYVEDLSLLMRLLVEGDGCDFSVADIPFADPRIRRMSSRLNIGGKITKFATRRVQAGTSLHTLSSSKY
jgi:hypothetical protein